MEQWSFPTVVPYWAAVPQKFGLWTQISPKFKL